MTAPPKPAAVVVLSKRRAGSSPAEIRQGLRRLAATQQEKAA